jgi:hypothetical protein
LPTSRWYRHLGKRQGTFVRELSEGEQNGNEGERDCPNAWTTHSVQDKSTTYILITYFPSWGTFVRYVFPSKFDSSTSTLIPLHMSWSKKKLHGIFQN